MTAVMAEIVTFSRGTVPTTEPRIGVTHEENKLLPMLKLKSISWVASAIALSLTAIVVPSFAQTTPRPPISERPAFVGVELTPQQQAEIEEIRLSARDRIEELLTEGQRQAFRDAVASGEGMRQAFAAMDLTPTQKEELRGIFRSTRSEMAAVLTPEQQDQIRQNIRQRRRDRF